MTRPIFLTLCAPMILMACKSQKQSNPSAKYIAPFEKNVEVGSYYRLQGSLIAFYDERPDSMITKTPTHYFKRGHVIQLLEPNAGAGWARVKSEKGEIGYLKFSSIKIVPVEDQPAPPKRKRSVWEM